MQQGQIKQEPNRGQRDTPMFRNPDMPIPQSIPTPTLTPSAVPPARPTLTGGANIPNFHVMNTPAIPKNPIFDHDDSTTLLSKRKLDELMKEIDPDVTLDVEVEDVRLSAYILLQCV